MGKSEGEPRRSGGQGCPALQKIQETEAKNAVNGEDLRFAQAAAEKLAAISQYLKEQAESAPAGARIGRASALARTGLRFAAVVLLAASVEVGLGDGDLFDNVGCTVAQQPRRVSHGADSGQAREHPDGKGPDCGADGPPGENEDGGWKIEDGGEKETSNSDESRAGIQQSTSNSDESRAGSDESRAGIESGDRRPECELRAEMCVNRMPDGLCRISNRPCLLFAGTGDVRDMLAGLIRGQKKLLAMGPPSWGKPEIRTRLRMASARQEPETLKSELVADDQPSKQRRKNSTANGKHGRFRFENGFLDVWLGGEHYDLRGRAKARFCIQYLIAKQAFDTDSARHLENEIDPFVRKKCQLPPPSEIRIQHYFNDRSGKLSRLRSDLVKAAGRNGRFYLQVT